MAGIIIILLVSLSIIFRSLGVFPFSSSTNSGNPPISSQAQNGPVVQASATSAPLTSARGQADKLAFVKASDIWASDLDGSNLTQLTSDQAVKSNLHWTPDGQSVVYTSGNCLNLVGLLTRQVLTLTCFTGAASITAFDISPDGQKAALGIDQTDLYLIPYTQLFNLPRSSKLADLLPLAQCSYYAPYDTKDILKGVNWSLDDSRLALLLSTLVGGILRDEVSIIDVNQCNASPQLVKQILPAYFLFTFPGYYEHPKISSLSWNGSDQLLLNNGINEAGFGDLQLYNLTKDEGEELAPNGSCCYRDAHWSPDGTYLFYSYQPEAGGEIRLYYTPSAELAQPRTSRLSLSLPEDFLAASVESLQPALRTAH